MHEEKNGVVNKAIVLQWAVRIASCDFKPGKKRESHKFELSRLKKKNRKMKNILACGHFLVRYFRDAF